MDLLRFVSDGERRLRQGIETQVRQEFQARLATANFWRRQILEMEIRREVAKRAKRLISPYSLWSSFRLR